jgi:hypothetical protein
MGLWLSAANTWAGTARGFWTAEMHRQQKIMLNEMTKLKGSLAVRIVLPGKVQPGAKKIQKLI